MKVSTKRAFTLVELLVVIGIIAVLIGILLPTLSKARGSAQALACKSLLRQYTLAHTMYANAHDGAMPDAYKYLDWNAGLPKYLGHNQMTEALTRCPSDSDARLGTFGSYTNAAASAVTGYDYTIRNKNGDPYTVKVSIGMNINPLSDGQRTTGTAPMVAAPRWIKPNKFRSAGNFDPTKIMVWSDYQNFFDDSTPAAPIIRPANTAVNDTTIMGTVAFRHGGSANVAFLDGHVGSIKATIALLPGGLDMKPGSNWTPNPWPAGLPVKPLYRHSQLYYPFGPGFEGSNVKMLGDYPTIRIE